jgi:hypothetical protein
MKINNEIIIISIIVAGTLIFMYTQYGKKENYVQSPPSVFNRLNDTPVSAAFGTAQEYADYAIDTGDKLLPLEFARTDFYKDVRKMQSGKSFDELSETYSGDAFHKSIMKSSQSAGAFNDGKLRADAINSGDVSFFEELVDNPARHKVSVAANPTEFELKKVPTQGGLYWSGYFEDVLDE